MRFIIGFCKVFLNKFVQNNENLSFVNDNQTTITWNVSAWQIRICNDCRSKNKRGDE